MEKLNSKTIKYPYLITSFPVTSQASSKDTLQHSFPITGQASAKEIPVALFSIEYKNSRKTPYPLWTEGPNEKEWFPT